MKKIIVGVLVVLVIVFLAVAVSTSANGSKIFQSLSAVLFSQKGSGSQTVAELTGPRALSGPELFGIIRHINTQIDAAVLVLEKEEARLMKARRSGGSSDGSDSDSSNGGGSSGGSSSGSLTPPKPVHAPTPEPITPTPEPEPQPEPEPEVQAEAEVLSDNCLDTVAVGANVISAIPCFLAKYVVPNYKKIVVPVVKTDTTQDQTTTVASSAEVASVQTLENLLLQRKSLMTQLAKADPRFFLLSGLSETAKAKIAAEYQENIEESVTVTGVIEVIHFDDFENHENSYFEYYLRVGEEKFNLRFVNPPTVSSGGTFRVTGIKTGLDIVVTGFEFIEDQVIPVSGPPDSVGEQRTLALLINYQNSGPNPISRSQFEDLLFNGPFQDFYTEQSYAKVHFSGDVSGWHTLPRPCNGSTIDWPSSPWQNNEIAMVIENQSIDLADYDRLLLIIDCGGYGGFGTVGKVTVGVGSQEYQMSVGWVGISTDLLASQWSSYHRLSLSTVDFVLAHEVGHNLGVNHANALDCGDSQDILSTNCQHIEYGNYFDTMGYGQYSLHFNAFYKELLGWIEPIKVVDIVVSGRYTINTLEESHSAKQLAKVRILGTEIRPFYLEYRRAIGFDGSLDHADITTNQNGLFVNKIVYNPQNHLSFPRLLDMRPTSPEWVDDVTDATLNNTQVFIDPIRGINIGPIVSTSSTTITFDVAIQNPACVRANPLVQVFRSNYVIPGLETYSEIYFENLDSAGCGNSDFNVVATGVSPSWKPKMIPEQSMSLSPSEGGGMTYEHVKTFQFRVPDDVSIGDHSFNFVTKNLTSGRTTTNSIDFSAIRPPRIQYLLPPRGPTGSRVTIYGSNMNDEHLMFAISGNEGYQYIYDQSAANGILAEFDFPNQLCVYGVQCDLIDTPPGLYSVTVYSNGFPSNTLTFEVTP